MDELCTACLCSGRNLYFIGETGFYQLFTEILNEIQVYDISQLCVRVCWECRATLHRFQVFKETAKRSYTALLQHLHQNTIPTSQPPRLQQQAVTCASYPYVFVKTEYIQSDEEHQDRDVLEPDIDVKDEVEHSEVTFVNDLKVEEDLVESDNGEFEAKRKRNDWTYVNKFNNFTEAQSALNEENTWSYNYTNESEGRRVYYRCNKIKKRGPQCLAEIYLLCDAIFDSVVMYKSDIGHNHRYIQQSELNNDVKTEISRLFDVHMKPTLILKALTKMHGLEVPKLSQIKNYVKDLRSNRIENETISLGQLKQWISTYSSIPENQHEPFVVESKMTEELTFSFAISTKYLLKFASEVDVIQIDVRHKLVWRGYPVLIMGTTDRGGKFHPFSLAIAAIGQNDFNPLFQGLKDRIQELFSCNFDPKVLVTTSDCIKNAFEEVFGNAVRICWNYVRKDIKLRKEVNKNIHKELLLDIERLHSITSVDVFDQATKLFIQKYNNEQLFLTYFENQWLLSNRNWYLGSVPNSPSTNKSLETFNRTVKNSYVLREKIQLSRFLDVTTELVKNWSLKSPERRIDNSIISLEDWTVSYKWAKLFKQVIVSHKDEINTYYDIPSGDSNELTTFAQPANFDEFIEQYASKYTVSLPLNKEWID